MGIDHDHGDHAHHGDETRRIDTGPGVVALEVFEDDVRPRWRLRTERGHRWGASDVTVVTERPDKTRQAFTFADRGDYLESIEEIPEPHAFLTCFSLRDGVQTHDYEVTFSEHDHGYDHGMSLKIGHDREAMDAHQRADASDISRRFDGKSVATGRILLFGLTGGLIPCPATVLLLCLQLKQLTLGIVLVAFFSVGLAVTMVSAGVPASLSVTHIKKRWTGFDSFARRAPYPSGGLMVLIAFYMSISGYIGLTGGHAPQI